MKIVECVGAVAIATVIIGAALEFATTQPSDTEVSTRLDQPFVATVTQMKGDMTRPCLGHDTILKCQRVMGYEFEKHEDDTVSVGSFAGLHATRVDPIVVVDGGRVIDVDTRDAEVAVKAKRDLYTWILHDEIEEQGRAGADPSLALLLMVM